MHGNPPALKAALAAARERGAELLVFGGDLAWGPLPAHWLLLGPGVEHVVTPYDAAAAGAAFRAAGGPEAEEFAAHAAAPPPASTAAELYG